MTGQRLQNVFWSGGEGRSAGEFPEKGVLNKYSKCKHHCVLRSAVSLLWMLLVSNLQLKKKKKRDKITLSWCQKGQADNSARLKCSVRKLCKVLEHSAQVKENIVYT